jgi:hypothetical protein
MAMKHPAALTVGDLPMVSHFLITAVLELDFSSD